MSYSFKAIYKPATHFVPVLRKMYCYEHFTSFLKGFFGLDFLISCKSPPGFCHVPKKQEYILRPNASFSEKPNCGFRCSIKPFGWEFMLCHIFVGTTEAGGASVPLKSEVPQQQSTTRKACIWRDIITIMTKGVYI